MSQHGPAEAPSHCTYPVLSNISWCPFIKHNDCCVDQGADSAPHRQRSVLDASLLTFMPCFPLLPDCSPVGDVDRVLVQHGPNCSVSSGGGKVLAMRLLCTTSCLRYAASRNKTAGYPHIQPRHLLNDLCHLNIYDVQDLLGRVTASLEMAYGSPPPFLPYHHIIRS